MQDKTRFTLRLPKKMLEQLNEIAENKYISCNSLIVTILDEYLDNKSKAERKGV